jgi:maleate cis-trans isomerase
MTFHGLLIRSSENPALPDTFTAGCPIVRWHDCPVTFRPGHGETPDERAQLRTDLQGISGRSGPVDLVVYARSYGAFSPEGRSIIQKAFGVPTVITTGSCLDQLRALGPRIGAVTPYGGARHAYELEWLGQNKIDVTTSAGMGVDAGAGIAAISAELTARTIRSVLDGPAPVDGVYVACTILPTARIPGMLSTQMPVVTATGATVLAANRLVEQLASAELA